jgi:hypothetical protein
VATAGDAATVAPLRTSASLATVAALFALVAVVTLPYWRYERGITGDGRAEGVRPPRDSAIEVTITPPDYIRAAPRTLRNPDRIDAVQGSRLSLGIVGQGRWRVRFGNDQLPLRMEGGRSIVDLSLAQSGYLAIEGGSGDATASRLVPVSVAPDRAPSIRVNAPAKDLLLPNAKPTIRVEASATDDYALQSLDLRFTKVSGTGEQFEFKEGSIPLDIVRESDRVWNARAQLALATLALAPGDSIVYRIVGRDRRPGEAGLSSSDTYLIEIAGPGQVALEGFEMPPDRERYALSQQMIVLKLERLHARERSLERAALEEEIGNIAAEQRAVRANFVFLTGGHVEDEEQEAEQSHEIQEGRLENTAHREIVAAIQHMSRAEQGMAAVSTAAALASARAAVAALQRAFGRNRYFLRTVPVRSRIDPSRRLSGETSSAADWRRELFPARFEAPDVAARTVLLRVIELAPEARAGSLPPAALTAVAEEALGVDVGSPEWQAISKLLLQVRDGLQNDAAERARLVNAAVGRIAAVVQRTAVPLTRPAMGDAALRSAWTEERRR